MPNVNVSQKAAGWTAAGTGYLTLKYTFSCLHAGVMIMPSDELLVIYGAWLTAVLHLIGSFVVMKLERALPADEAKAP